ncbi:MAG: pyridoxal phosphate-dependent aminotransferase [Planctomycetota bacterium]
MDRAFPFELLRPDVPRRPPFAVREVPHRAKLDQNESPGDVPAAVKQAILAALEAQWWSRYPQPKRYAEIKAAFAEVVGVPADRLLLTAGCDQMILLAYLAAGGAGRRARVFEPSYPMYDALARATQTELDRVILDADYDVEGHGPGDPVDLLLLTAPNNPTGSGPGPAFVEAALHRPGIVFVDEAYADYAGTSVVDLLPDHPNLLVARSLSKSALAGIRLGYGIGHPQLVEVLERLIFAPYNLNHLQLAVAASFDRIAPHVGRVVRDVVAERGRIETRLGELGIRYWPSRGNFVLFRVDDAPAAHARFLERAVRIRDVSPLPGLESHLRVTVGAPEENDLFLEVLGEWVAGAGTPPRP